MRSVSTLAVLAVVVAGAGAQPARPTLPDVQGIRLGMTAAEVKARAAELKLMPETEQRAQLQGLPNGTWVSTMQFSDAAMLGNYVLRLSPPPATSQVQHIRRDMGPPPDKAPPAAAVLEALLAKFGPPTRRVTQQQGASEQLTWVWSADGRLQKATPGFECQFLAAEFERNDVKASSDAARRVIDGGCGVWMFVALTIAPSGVLQTLQHQAVDVAGADQARRATERAINAATQQGNQQELQRARQNKPSI